MPPHYRKFSIWGYESSVKPIGFREFIILRWWPYFFWHDIELSLEIKPNTSTTSIVRIPRLDYTWQLFRTDSTEPEHTGDGSLTIDLVYNDRLSAILKLPHRISSGQHTLEIQVKQGDHIWAYSQPIFDFELHSEDKLLFRVVLPAISLALGMFLLYVIQRIFGWPIV